jgi:hypothetical protein
VREGWSRLQPCTVSWISELVDADNQPRPDKGVNVAKFPDDGKNVFVGSGILLQTPSRKA